MSFLGISTLGLSSSTTLFLPGTVLAVSLGKERLSLSQSLSTQSPKSPSHRCLHGCIRMHVDQPQVGTLPLRDTERFLPWSYDK